VVFEAVEEIDADGERKMAEVWIKRREPFHNELFAGKSPQKQTDTKTPKHNPADTLDVKLEIY
jgi:hypothetical protein